MDPHRPCSIELEQFLSLVECQQVRRLGKIKNPSTRDPFNEIDSYLQRGRNREQPRASQSTQLHNLKFCSVEWNSSLNAQKELLLICLTCGQVVTSLQSYGGKRSENQSKSVNNGERSKSHVSRELKSVSQYNRIRIPYCSFISDLFSSDT